MVLSRWKHRLIFLLLVTTISLASYHFGSLAATSLRSREQPAPVPTINGLFIDPQALDLGEMWETPAHTFPLTIHNQGSVARTIDHFLTTCGCLQLVPQGKTISPGDKAEFVGKLDLMPGFSQVGLTQWPLSVRLDPVFAGDITPTRGWELKADVRNRLSLSAPKLAFEDRCAHKGDRVWRKVRAKAHVPLKSLQASIVPKSAAEVRVEAIATNPSEYFIFVSPDPTLPIGPFVFSVRLQAVTDGDEVHPCSTIEVVGAMQPTSRVIP